MEFDESESEDNQPQLSPKQIEALNKLKETEKYGIRKIKRLLADAS